MAAALDQRADPVGHAPERQKKHAYDFQHGGRPMAQLENQRYQAGLQPPAVAQKMPAGHALNNVAVGSPYSFHSLIVATCLHTRRWRRAHEALLL